MNDLPSTYGLRKIKTVQNSPAKQKTTLLKIGNR